MGWTQIDGENRGDIRFYALSTCGWCRKTKQFLDELGVAYRFFYVDLLTGDERDEAVRELEGWNPRRSFPTVVFNGSDVVVGYKPDRIKELLGM